MIYLDVTGSCKSAKSTGIQRATRSIFRELGRRETILPMNAGALSRSEEHTSELQSRVELVCRLLLEKKNKKRGSRCSSIRQRRPLSRFARGRQRRLERRGGRTSAVRPDNALPDRASDAEGGIGRMLA